MHKIISRLQPPFVPFKEIVLLSILFVSIAVLPSLSSAGSAIQAGKGGGIEFGPTSGHTRGSPIRFTPVSKDPLIIAVKQEDFELVKKLIKEGADIDSLGVQKETPLMIASGKGYLDIAQFLISSGADVNMKDSLGFTPLLYALRSGQDETTQLLLENKADIYIVDSNGLSPMMYAAGSGMNEIIELLISKGANINILTRSHGTPLLYALFKGHPETAKLLIKSGAKIHIKFSNGTTALMEASAGGFKEIVEILVLKGLDVNAVNRGGFTSLLKAATRGNKEIVDLLISEGADVNAMSSRGYGLLLFASEKGWKDIVELSISKGADVNRRTHAGNTPLIKAAESGHKEIVELLISNGADIHAKNQRGFTPIHVAAITGARGIVDLLISEGDKLDVDPELSYTMLVSAIVKGSKNGVGFLIEEGVYKNLIIHDIDAPYMAVNADRHTRRKLVEQAIDSKRFEIAELLIQNGVDINIRYENINPLITRYLNLTNIEKLNFLIQLGADLEIRDRSGKTPLMIVACKKSADSRDVSELLIKNGADVNAQMESVSKGTVDDGATPLIFAAYCGEKENVELLIQSGADVNKAKPNGATALHLAVINREFTKKHKDVAELLLLYGLKVDAQDNTGSTPLMRAARIGNLDAVKFLISHGADVNAKNGSGESAFSIALDGRYRDSLSIAQYFIDNGADMNGTKKGEPLLVYYIHRGQIAELLINNGADVNVKDSNGYPALLIALSRHNEHTSKLLIEHGADVNVTNSRGMTPLMLALSNRNITLAELLITKGADVNAKDKNGFTPLLMAAGGDDPEAVKFLISRGADVNAVADIRGNKYALLLAYSLGMDPESLISEDADLNTEESNGLTALMMAASGGQLEIVKLLVSNGADVNATADINGFKFTPFVAASLGRHNDIVEYLLLNGVDEPAGYKDAKFSSPEKTWELYKKALIAGDIDLALQCLTPERALKEKQIFDAIGKDIMKKMAMDMRPIQEITQDSESAKYRIRRYEEYGGKETDITYYIYFMNVFGNWKIAEY